MNTNITMARQPSDLMSTLSIKESVGDNINTLPLAGGDFVFDPKIDPIEQIKAILLHHGRDIPDEVLLQKIKMPDGLSNEQKDEWISDNVKLAGHEFNKASDTYYNAVASVSNDVIEDGRSHITGIYDLIDNVNKNYQQSFGEITKKATKFMEEVNTAIGSISGYMTSGDNGEIKFDAEGYLKNILDKMESYSGRKFDKDDESLSQHIWGKKDSNGNPITGAWDREMGNAKPIHSISNTTNEEFNFWQKKLDGQGFIVKRDGDSIKIFVDLMPVAKVLYAVANISTGNTSISSQRFQSLQTAIDSHKNAVNNSISRLLETFRQDNSHFETLTQLLIQLLKDLFQYNAGYANT